MAKRSSTTDDAPRGKSGAWTAKTLPRLILIIGPENILREEALARVRKAAFGEGDGGMNWVVFHGPTSKNEAEALEPAAFLDETCTGSMFAAEDEMKIVVVRQADLFLGDKEYRPILERAQERIPETSTLVLEAANPGNVKTTSFYKNLDKAGAVIVCESLTDRWGNTQELELEIEKRAKARKLKLAPGALNALLERSARNLGVIDEELDKLALALQPAEGAEVPITEHDVAEFCASTRTFNAFNFADAVIDRDLKHALEILGAIFDRGIADSAKPGKVVNNDGTIAMLLLGALTWRVAQMQDYQNLADSGMNDYKAMAEVKVFGPGRQEAFKRTMRKHNAQSVRRCMEALYRANLNLRRGRGSEPGDELIEALYLSNAGARRAGGASPQEVLEEMVWTMAGK